MSLKLWVGMTWLALALLLPMAGGAEPSPMAIDATPPLVNNVFFETDLRQALQDVASEAKVTIVAAPEVSGTVSCDLQNLPVEQALQLLLAGTGFESKKMERYYLVCSSDPDSPSFDLISETRVVKMGHTTAESAVKSLAKRFQNYVQADTDNNQVCITAPPRLLERIVADLARINQPPMQVLLNARIMVLETADLRHLGVTWDWPQAAAGIFSNDQTRENPVASAGAEWPWGVRVGYTPDQEFTNALMASLNLMAQNDEAVVIANPQVMAQDGKTAQFNVTTEEYFNILSEEAFYVRSTLEKIEVGTVLKITPRVSATDEITLLLSTEVSDVIARGADNLPVVNRRNAESTVRVKDGGTAAVAGLMDTRSSVNEDRVPGLHHIPLVGKAFKDESGRQSSRQIAVFVTARLVPEEPFESLQQGAQAKPLIAPVGDDFTREVIRTMWPAGTEGKQP